MRSEQPTQPWIRIDTQKFGPILPNLLIGLGFLIIYSVLLLVAIGLVGSSLLALAKVLPEIWVALSVPALLAIWTVTFMTVIEGLEECGIELRLTLSWLLFPIALPLGVVLLGVLTIGGAAEHCPPRLKLLSLCTGALVLAVFGTGWVLVLW
jgi:hypothetical protein